MVEALHGPLKALAVVGLAFCGTVKLQRVTQRGKRRRLCRYDSTTTHIRHSRQLHLHTARHRKSKYRKE